jgi:hypothetical protein
MGTSNKPAIKRKEDGELGKFPNFKKVYLFYFPFLLLLSTP